MRDSRALCVRLECSGLILNLKVHILRNSLKSSLTSITQGAGKCVSIIHILYKHRGERGCLVKCVCVGGGLRMFASYALLNFIHSQALLCYYMPKTILCSIGSQNHN